MDEFTKLINDMKDITKTLSDLMKSEVKSYLDQNKDAST